MDHAPFAAWIKAAYYAKEGTDGAAYYYEYLAGAKYVIYKIADITQNPSSAGSGETTYATGLPSTGGAGVFMFLMILASTNGSGSNSCALLQNCRGGKFEKKNFSN